MSDKIIYFCTYRTTRTNDSDDDAVLCIISITVVIFDVTDDGV